MASTHENPDPETGKSEPIPASATTPPPSAASFLDCRKIDVIIRVLLFSATLTALIVMVTSDQTEMTQLPGVSSPAPVSAEFNDSPAFIFFVVALVVTSFYALMSTLVSISLLLKPEFTARVSVYLASLDMVMLGILASATGTAGGVAYIALKGNEEVGWNKICNVYDKFCRYIATSLALSLFATLLLLVLSICSALNSSLILHWVNRFCIGSEFISINARTHVSFYGETRRRNEINLCFSQCSIICEAVVSDKSPFLKSTPRRTRSLESVRLYVALPLDTVSDCKTVNHTKAIAAGLKALKLLGVEGVELPIFWGVAETESPGNYQWSGYLAIAEMVKKPGLKLHVSLCFHGSKQPGLSLPDWVTRIGETEPGIYFTDRSGSQYKDCLSFAVDDVHVLDGKTPMEVYRGFLESFKSAFSDFLGNTLTGITIGLGPDAELRYPSHQTRKLSDGAGEFQCYDKYMLVALKHMLWGLSGPHDAPSYDQRPNSAPFFSDGGSWESEYGDFFLAWYSSLLVSHADRVLSLASSVFSGTGLPLCGKLPLLHQWHKLRSRPSESTAGFYCNGDNDRYEAVAETFAKNSCRMILPGMDLSDEYQSPKSLSSPESLLAHIKTCCKKHGVVVSGQNSSEPNLGGFEKIKENLKDENAAIDLFTYQRMGALFFSPDHFHAFTELSGTVASLSNQKMIFYQQKKRRMLQPRR